MLTTDSAGFGGETVREVGLETIRRDSEKLALTGSTRPRVVTLRKSTPLPPHLNPENKRYEGYNENIGDRVPLTEVLAVPPTVPLAEVSEVVA